VQKQAFEPDIPAADKTDAARNMLPPGKHEASSAEALKKELESHSLGTDKVSVEVKGDKAIIRGDVSNEEILEKAIIAIGNTHGISKVEADVVVPDAKHAVIFEVNKPMLSHPDKIYPGQVLRIPDLGRYEDRPCNRQGPAPFEQTRGCTALAASGQARRHA